MPMPQHAPSSVRFGPFELCLENEELRKHGARLKLAGQALQVLAVLVEHAGQVVTREDLQRKLWPTSLFGDFEHGLNAAVNRLRETLGDSATRCRRSSSTTLLPLQPLLSQSSNVGSAC